MRSSVSAVRLFTFFFSLYLAGLLPAAVRSKSQSKSPSKSITFRKAAAAVKKSKQPRATKSLATTTRTRSAAVKTRKAVLSSRSRKRLRLRRARYIAGGPWTEPSFADSTLGDNIEGEDLTVRRAAVEALGPYNGTVVVADPTTGRLLSVVNQRVAFREGFQPCSTIKIVTAVAGLHEGIIDRDTNMRLYRRMTMNLTDALALSNNLYFANIGVRLGYEKIAYYSRLLGLGEKAGFGIESELPGLIPEAAPKYGGMGMMTSFGEGLKLTPLQLTAMLSAIANGGTLYYLQYPRSEAEAEAFVPRIKRQLAIQDAIPDVKPGLLGAVEYGTGRKAAYDPNEPIFGKTGTCTDRATPTHLGWFGSFNEVAGRKLVVVVLLTGGRAVNGPVAASIAGSVYRNLSQQRFFAKGAPVAPVALVSGSY
jgi:penicillin-binding protein 2